MLQINESTLVGIADAIRSKEGSTEPIPTVDMAERIANLPSGGSSVVICSFCGANATVTATSISESYSATADENGTAYIFIDSLGTYTISSNKMTPTVDLTVTDIKMVYSTMLTNAPYLIENAVFYTDFDGSYDNKNNKSSYYITPSITPSYYTDGRQFVYTNGNQFSFSSELELLLKSKDMTILAVLNIYQAFRNDKGSRLFDFYYGGTEQGVYVYGNNVRGQSLSSYTSISDVSLDEWVVIGLSKNENSALRTVSVCDTNNYTQSEIADKAPYNDVRFLSKQSYALTYAYCGGLLIFDRKLTDNEIEDLSKYLISNIKK